MQADQLNKEQITDININLQSLANVGDTLANFNGSLALKSGGTLHIKTDFNIPNQSADGHISLNKVPLNTLLSLAKAPLFPLILDGYELLETDFSVNGFSHDAKLHIKNAAVQVNDFSLQEKDQQKDLITIPKFSVAGLDLNLKQSFS